MDVVDAARTLPMMVPRRVVLVLHAERLLDPKKESEAASKDLEALEAYVKAPVDTACLVLVAGNLDKRRSLTKLLLSKAGVVECAGPADAGEAARWVRDRVSEEGMTIDALAARLVADRVGPDIGRLRADVDRLVLYAAGNKAITAEDVLEVVGAAHVAGRLGRDARHRARRGRRRAARARAADGWRRRALHDPRPAGLVRQNESARPARGSGG